MSNNEKKPVAQPEGELSDQQLDSVSGGQQVVNSGTIITRGDTSYGIRAESIGGGGGDGGRSLTGAIGGGSVEIRADPGGFEGR